MTLHNDTTQWHYTMTMTLHNDNDTTQWHYTMTLHNDTTQ